MKVKKEEIKVKGEQLLAKVKAIIKEGNVRRMTIKDKDGNVLLSIPMTVGVIGAVLAPILAAVGAVAALVAECTISVERTTVKKKKK
jgi:phage-related minor tail protein